MGELIWELVPVVLGVVASPLAIMALVAVLLSRRARANGLTYLIGWAAAVILSLSIAYGVFGLLELGARHDPPMWVPIARLLLAAVLFSGAIWTYRRSRAQLRQMAAAATPEEVSAAAPQLPGWLQTVQDFSPLRSFALGLGIFVLNPVNMSCAIVAALDIRLASVGQGPSLGVLIGFAVVGILPMAIPVVLTYVRGERAEPTLAALRGWIAAHNGTLSVVLLVVVGFMQIQKAIPVLL
ncbi:GAP family protein [Occultella kanbiaonis]|uniref:GAP family protein n=1 Tax=Occultella kanbiaonis TaxID=2675754 RepID=UPI0013D1C846|nr:GAP family protein [Occultella kanbiaonis]